MARPGPSSEPPACPWPLESSKHVVHDVWFPKPLSVLPAEQILEATIPDTLAGLCWTLAEVRPCFGSTRSQTYSIGFTSCLEICPWVCGSGKRECGRPTLFLLAAFFSYDILIARRQGVDGPGLTCFSLQEKAISIWESENFFFDLEPLPGAVEAVKQMANLEK